MPDVRWSDAETLLKVPCWQSAGAILDFAGYSASATRFPPKLERWSECKWGEQHCRAGRTHAHFLGKFKQPHLHPY